MTCSIKVFLIHALIFLTLGTAQAEAALTVEDCRKCHDREWQQISSQGMAHKEKVNCQDCHKSHRPLSANNIPACSDCHGDAPHGSMVDCSTCHQRKETCKACHQVHQPLARTDGETALQHCKVCHPSAYELLTASKSKHHDLSCAACHPKHREIRMCGDCHGQPHPQGTHKMFPQCVTCHNIAHDLNRMAKK